MGDGTYVVERTIEDVTFPESRVEGLRENIRTELAAEDEPIVGEKVERKLRRRLLEIADDMTLAEQGDNRLHNEIEYGRVRLDE